MLNILWSISGYLPDIAQPSLLAFTPRHCNLYQFGYNAPEPKGREKPRGMETAYRLYSLLAGSTVSVRIFEKVDDC